MDHLKDTFPGNKKPKPNAKSNPKNQPPQYPSARHFTIQEFSEQTSRTMDEARQIVGLGVQMGKYEAAGEGMYRMTREANKAHHVITDRVRGLFKKLIRYGILPKDGIVEFKKDMNYLKMEGWDATWIPKSEHEKSKLK